MFNLFRVAGDLVHVASIYLLLAKIWSSHSVAGLSLKTQLIYMAVYCCRYLDLFINPFSSLYNLVFKLGYLGSQGYILYMMQKVYRSTSNPQLDTFKTRYLYIGSGILALVFTHNYSVREVLWSFSIWLESVAILPQLFMVQRTGKAESMTSHYIFALGAYRALYFLNWLYRWLFRSSPDYIAVLGGIIQTALYSDFFYVYYTKVVQGQSFTLPV